jgi:EAL domain-containing protein (putative c-di-GMP-specific phosphodiesterase class I)
LRLAINLSARQFQQPRLIATIERILTETGLDPRYLEFELTESSVMKEPDEAIKKLNELKQMGVTISIDDFGTGYSSLNYLKRFPIDTLKIDKSFVREISTDPDVTAIVTAIITLAHALKLNVIAEGVETEEQFKFLRSLGCDEVQGFLFGRPISADEFTALLIERSRISSSRNYETNPLPPPEGIAQPQLDM